MENEDDYPNKVVFSDEATLHLSGKANRHNLRIWGTEYPHEKVEHVVGLTRKLNAFCAVSSVKVYGYFLLVEPTVTGLSYLNMLANCLMSQLLQDIDKGYMFQQDGVPRTSIARLLPTSIAWWLLGLDVVERQIGHHDRLT
jgi:hypothetical protein